MARTVTRQPVQITNRLETITPRKAADYLATMEENRPVRKRMVESLARDIKSGSWAVNGDAIRFNTKDKLIDGQHRLLAVIAADASIQTYVVRGLNGEAKETMDQGARRSFGDILKLRGEDYYSALAAVVRMHWMWVNSANPLTRKLQPTTHELSVHLSKNPELRLATRLARETWTTLKAPVAATGPLFYEAFRLNEQDALFFVEKLNDGVGLSGDHPVYALRKYLIKYSQTPGSLRTEILLGYMIKGWNAYRDGITTDRIVFRHGGANPEKFPAVR